MLKKLLLNIFLFFLFTGLGRAQQIDPDFNPKFERGANVLSLLKLHDGKYLAGGFINSAEGRPTSGLVKVGLDGAVDLAFDPEISAWHVSTTCIIEQPDHKILIGGNVLPTAPQERRGINRLLPNGSLDNSFTSSIASGIVFSMVLQPDGKIIIGGNFTLLDHPNLYGIARLLPDGSIDETFKVTMPPGGNVKTIKQQADGKLLIAGDFKTFNGSSAYQKLVRLLPDGSIDASFSWNNYVHESNGISSLLPLPNGKTIFTTNRKVDAADTGYIGIGCLNPDGSLDHSFENVFLSSNPSYFSGEVTSIGLQNDKIILGGTFLSRPFLKQLMAFRLNLNGALDNTFQELPVLGSGNITNITVEADYNLVVSGNYENILGTRSNGINRLTPAGNLISSFRPNVKSNGIVARILLQNDSKIIAAGTFSSVNNIETGSAVRLNPDGTLDASFNFGHYFSGLFPPAAVQGDKIIVFSSSERTLKRLEYNGNEDPAFIKIPSVSVLALAVGPDGKIAVAGSVNNKPFARLLADGSLDEGFSISPLVHYNPQSIALQADGKIVAGRFHSTNPLFNPTSIMMRLNADGTVDDRFDIGTGPDNTNINATLVSGILPEANGNMLVSGQFQYFNGNFLNNSGSIVRLSENGSFLEPFSVPGAQLGNVYQVIKESEDSYLLAATIVNRLPRGVVRVLSAPLSAREESKRTQSMVQVRPNPFTNAVNLQVGAYVKGNVEVRVLSTDGKVLSTNSYTSAANPTLMLDHLSNGIYLLETIANGKRETQRIIKINP